MVLFVELLTVFMGLGVVLLICVLFVLVFGCFRLVVAFDLIVLLD